MFDNPVFFIDFQNAENPAKFCKILCFLKCSICFYKRFEMEHMKIIIHKRWNDSNYSSFYLLYIVLKLDYYL